MSEAQPDSFYWFDYETFGRSPIHDRPCQFAGVRTNAQLEIIGEPLTIMCRQAPDYLPEPGACRVTGLSPITINQHGLSEAEFIRQALAELGRDGTCSVGYNSVAFDDEFTRHTAFRNFHPPYEHEWKNGNSRWDLLDIVRLTRALRPEQMIWPVKADGRASNRLEDLSKANGIEHSHAHDALSDVYATLGIARLIRDRYPKLWEFALKNRSKQAVLRQLDVIRPVPCILISGKIPAARHHLAVILPLARLPDRPNSIIAIDLHHDPSPLFDLTAEQIAERLFARRQAAETSNKPTDQQTSQPINGSHESGTGSPEKPRVRPGLMLIPANKCPVVVPISTLRKSVPDGDVSDAERLGLDMEQINRHRQTALALHADQRQQEKLIAAMSVQKQGLADNSQSAGNGQETGVEETLYSGGFPSQHDEALYRQIRKAQLQARPRDIPAIAERFEDERLVMLARHYQARNFPESLNAEETAQWHQYCRERLNQAEAPWMNFTSFRQALQAIDWKENEQSLHSDLRRYVDDLENQLQSRRLAEAIDAD